MADVVENRFDKPGKCLFNCEAKLVVEGRCFYVCKERLSQISEFFKIMFEGKFKERKEQKFEIQDETYDDILVFLKVLELDSNINKIRGNQKRGPPIGESDATHPSCTRSWENLG